MKKGHQLSQSEHFRVSSRSAPSAELSKGEKFEISSLLTFSLFSLIFFVTHTILINPLCFLLFTHTVTFAMAAAVAPSSSSAATATSIVVAGATGAIGREFIMQAVSDDYFSRVVALSRRDIPEARWTETWPGLDMMKAKDKLKVYSIDWEALCDPNEAAVKASKNAAEAFTGNAYAVNLMGSTRKDAGSAEAFHRYDYDYYEAFVRAVKTFNPFSASAADTNAAFIPSSSVRHFSQISSTGASASSWFLYMKTKGQADEMLMRSGSTAFSKISFWRPGLLGRKEKARTVEKIGAYFSTPMPVERVAAAMIVDLKTNEGLKYGEVGTCKDAPERPDKNAVRIFYNADIIKLTPSFDKQGGSGGCCTSADSASEKQQKSDL